MIYTTYILCFGWLAASIIFQDPISIIRGQPCLWFETSVSRDKVAMRRLITIIPGHFSSIMHQENKVSTFIQMYISFLCATKTSIRKSNAPFLLAEPFLLCFDSRQEWKQIFSTPLIFVSEHQLTDPEKNASLCPNIPKNYSRKNYHTCSIRYNSGKL